MPTATYRTRSEPDIRAMQELAQVAWRQHALGLMRQPSFFPLGISVGGLAWAWGCRTPSLQEAWKHRLWYDSEALVAWGWIHPPEMIRISAERTELSSATLIYNVPPQ